jgi:hypothetical protein
MNMMTERPFPDKSNKPTEQTMQDALGGTYTYYKKIVGLASSFLQEWTFTKNSGWMFKLHDRKKALFYLIPLKNGFKLSLTIRDDEREVFLRDSELAIMHDKISSSKKYTEGFALQFDITNKGEFQPLELFIQKLIAIRM